MQAVLLRELQLQLLNNRSVKAQIDTAAFEKSNAVLTIQDIKDFGPMTMFAGLPVRMMGSLLDTESAIS